MEGMCKYFVLEVSIETEKYGANGK